MTEKSVESLILKEFKSKLNTKELLYNNSTMIVRPVIKAESCYNVLSYIINSFISMNYSPSNPDFINNSWIKDIEDYTVKVQVLPYSTNRWRVLVDIVRRIV